MRIYSVKKIAKMLYVEDETVRRWIRDSKIKAHRRSKKEGFIVNENDLLDFIKDKPKYHKMFEAELLTETGISSDELIRRQIKYLITQRDEINERIIKLQSILEES